MAEKTWFPYRGHAMARLHSVEGCGRALDPEVLDIAQSIAVRVVPYAESLIRDEALATSLLEESAASVSRVVRKRAQLNDPPLANVEAYPFRASMRRVNIAKRKELLVSTTITSAQTGPPGRSEIQQNRRISLLSFVRTWASNRMWGSAAIGSNPRQ